MPNQSTEFDFLVFIGRFQPFHLGHLHVIREALKLSQQIIVLCGSAHQARSTRNPWSIGEREGMIRSCLAEVDNARLHLAPLMDSTYNDEVWVRNVQSTVNGLVTAHHDIPHRVPKIGLIGHSKDQSSYYLNLFPQWTGVNVNNFESLSATPLRERIFGESGDRFIHSKEIESMLPESVQNNIKAFMASEAFTYIKSEQDFVGKYKKSWESAPYTPTFVTVDAVVVQSGHILMVERKASPGRGLLALPGGFVDQDERLVDACLRELREETRLKVPAPVLKGSIKSQQVFDEPYRSARGRTITHAFHIELAPNSELPKVKGGDDARYARWVPLAELKPAELFEDHYFIIQEMIGF